MKTLLFTLSIVVVLAACAPASSAFALDLYPAQKIGHDVSWPNCNAQLPVKSPFGIVGATGGLVFHPNPCLFEESHWFSNLSLYMNTGYAGKIRAVPYESYPRHCSLADETCLAYNFGYNAGKYAIMYAASQYVHSNVWWLDVETENSWSTNTGVNRASLIGMVAAIQKNTVLPVIGFYSYPGQWNTITGGWQNGYPNWVATGNDRLQTATAYCDGQAFNGGKTLLTQYTTRLDNDYVCR